MIACSVLTLLTAGGLIASFVLMDMWRNSAQVYLCDLQMGNCSDRADNTGVTAWVDVNITVGNCDYVNQLQMQSLSRNCASRKSEDTLTYQNKYYVNGAFSCHVTVYNTCIWDGGDFANRETILITTGATSASVFLLSFVATITLLSMIVKERRTTWNFQNKNMS